MGMVGFCIRGVNIKLQSNTAAAEITTTNRLLSFDAVMGLPTAQVQTFM